MDKLREFLSSKIPDWILISLLVIALLLIYSSVYTNDYLMNDELSEIGTNKDLFDRVRNLYFVSGRGLVGIPNVLIYRLIGFQHLWVLAFRFIHLCL